MFNLKSKICNLKSLRWLLLRHAVHRAQAPDEISGIDREDLALREQLRQRVERYAGSLGRLKTGASTTPLAM